MVLNQNVEKNLKKNEKIEKSKNFFLKIFSTRNEEHKSVSCHRLWEKNKYVSFFWGTSHPHWFV